MCPTPCTGRLIAPMHSLEPLVGGGGTTHSALSRMCPYVELPYVPNYWWGANHVFSSEKKEKKLLCQQD
jgi:hypothetical protein